MNKNILKEKGFGAIEIFIGISLSAILLTVFLTVILQSINISRENIKELKARMYLRELIEIARDLENSDWDLIVGCSFPCYPTTTSSISGDLIWNRNSGKEPLEGNSYERWIVVEDVCRDDDFKIIDSCVAKDENSRKIIANIDIINNDGSIQRSSKIETYIYNYGN